MRSNEVTQRTHAVITATVSAILTHLKESVDTEQDRNEFLLGVPAILEALKSKKIECRVFDKSKFHAKAYITYFRDDYRAQFIHSMNVPAGYALVGSSNFTKAGLTQNIELNVQIKDDVEQLQEWFEYHWNQGVDITEAILTVIEKHVKEYSPYDVYLRSMFEYFKTREQTISEWENLESVIYPNLAQYQRDGYNSMVEIANAGCAQTSWVNLSSRADDFYCGEGIVAYATAEVNDGVAVSHADFVKKLRAFSTLPRRQLIGYNHFTLPLLLSLESSRC